MNVLVVSAGYLPGYKYGGPVRSLAALVDQLGDEISFSVVTMGSDLDEKEPYSGVQLNAWNRVGNTDVWYMPIPELSPNFWRRVIAETQPDVLYLNSVMWPVTTTILLYRKLGLISRLPVVLAPRGEMAKSALAIKPRKKTWFNRLARLTRLHSDVSWQASSESEAKDIRDAIVDNPAIVIAPDLVISVESAQPLPAKRVGLANMCWLGRIAPVKNMTGGLDILKTVEAGHVFLAAYGPIEDAAYWQTVTELATGLPDHIQFEHQGVLEHAQVSSALRQHQFFFFPTFGENFGHVIAEALSQGLPVILSDQTPWRNLEAAGVGWDIPLDDTDRWTEVINYCIAMDDDEYQAMSAKCRGYVDIWMEEHGGRQANLQMFESALRAENNS